METKISGRCSECIHKDDCERRHTFTLLLNRIRTSSLTRQLKTNKIQATLTLEITTCPYFKGGDNDNKE